MADNSVVLEEEYDASYEPTDQEILEYATFLGLNPKTEPHLLWVARDGLKAPLPEDWKPCQGPDGGIYYFNFKSGESIWDHPCDDHYKTIYKQEKSKEPEPPSDWFNRPGSGRYMKMANVKAPLKAPLTAASKPIMNPLKIDSRPEISGSSASSLQPKKPLSAISPLSPLGKISAPSKISPLSPLKPLLSPSITSMGSSTLKSVSKDIPVVPQPKPLEKPLILGSINKPARDPEPIALAAEEQSSLGKTDEDNEPVADIKPDAKKETAIANGPTKAFYSDQSFDLDISEDNEGEKQSEKDPESSPEDGKQGSEEEEAKKSSSIDFVESEINDVSVHEEKFESDDFEMVDVKENSEGELKRQMKSISNSFDQQLDDFKISQEASFQTKCEEIRKGFDEEYETLERKLKAEHNAKLDELKSDLDAEFIATKIALKKEHDEILQDLRNDMEDEMEEEKERKNEQLAQDEHTGRLKEILEDYQKELKVKAEEHEHAMNQENETFKLAMEQLREDHAKKLEGKKLAFEEEFNKLEEDHDEKIKAVQKEYETKEKEAIMKTTTDFHDNEPSTQSTTIQSMQDRKKQEELASMDKFFEVQERKLRELQSTLEQTKLKVAQAPKHDAYSPALASDKRIGAHKGQMEKATFQPREPSSEEKKISGKEVITENEVQNLKWAESILNRVLTRNGQSPVAPTMIPETIDVENKENMTSDERFIQSMENGVQKRSKIQAKRPMVETNMHGDFRPRSVSDNYHTRHFMDDKKVARPSFSPSRVPPTKHGVSPLPVQPIYDDRYTLSETAPRSFSLVDRPSSYQTMNYGSTLPSYYNATPPNIDDIQRGVSSMLAQLDSREAQKPKRHSYEPNHSWRDIYTKTRTTHVSGEIQSNAHTKWLDKYRNNTSFSSHVNTQ